MYTIKIKPKQIFTDPSYPMADELYLQINNLIPNSSAEFLIDFRNSEQGSLNQKVYKMENEDYMQWDDDFPFLEEWALRVTNTEKAIE